ncbi:MAG: hypothetical protein KDB14_10955 [Planctomycetales bacterium]|nr:hypothetical protein [Planctomycetales bacterium]
MKTPFLVAGCLALLITAPVRSQDDSQPNLDETVELLASLSDPVFNQYVNFAELDGAWTNLDAGTLSDIGIKLANAERILFRNHPAVSSKDVLKVALRTASVQGDVKALEKVEAFAKETDNGEMVGQIKLAKQLAGTSRSLAPQVSLDEVDLDTLIDFKEAQHDLKAALVIGDADLLKELQEQIQGYAEKAPAIWSKLSAEVEQQLKSMKALGAPSRGGPDDMSRASNALNKLSGASRILGGRIGLAIGGAPGVTVTRTAPGVSITRTAPGMSIGPRVAVTPPSVAIGVTPGAVVGSSVTRVGPFGRRTTVVTSGVPATTVVPGVPATTVFPGAAATTVVPTPGFAPAIPGFAPATPGFAPATPGFAPATPGFAPAAPGFAPAAPGFGTATPGFPATTPGFPTTTLPTPSATDLLVGQWRVQAPGVDAVLQLVAGASGGFRMQMSTGATDQGSWNPTPGVGGDFSLQLNTETFQCRWTISGKQFAMIDAGGVQYTVTRY